MASGKGHLRAVAEGEKAKSATPKSITEALDGSSRDVLAAMRRALAQKLDKGELSSNSIASAYKELRELDRLIRAEDALSQEGGEGDPDESDRRSFDASAI